MALKTNMCLINVFQNSEAIKGVTNLRHFTNDPFRQKHDVDQLRSK